MIIKSSFELPISEENEALIPIIAAGLGYSGEGDPKRFIEKHFNDFYGNIRIITESGLRKHFGDIGTGTVDEILAQYDAKVINSVTIENDTNK